MVGAGTVAASEELALEDALEHAESVHEPVEGPGRGRAELLQMWEGGEGK